MSDLIIKVGKTDPKRQIAFKKALDGKIIVFDHPMIDIVIDAGKQKISTFAKDTFGDHVYDSQDQLFKHLMTQGIVDYDSVHAGNVFNGMEAKYLSARDNRDVLDEILIAIKKHIDEILPYYEAMEKFTEQYEDSLLEPDSDSSTELGAVSQKSRQGSMDKVVRNTYNTIYESKK